MQPVVLADRFELVDKLGAGAMGEVYRARDRTREQDIALKVLPELDATALARFKHEFRALHDVQHPNLVAVHELHEDHGTWFFTMQLVDGVDFLEWVEASETRLRDGLAQVARALHRLHLSGLVHRDVKPSNIRVTPAGKAILLDFGLVTPTWSPGEAAGTPAFMAPEQIDGDVTPATDWYAFGVLLFRALTGRFPFAGTPEQIMRAKATRPAPLVSDIAPNAPRDLAQLADRLLALSPQARPGGDTVLVALDSIAEPSRFAGQIIVGRDRELEQLRELHAERMRGTAFVASVAGESGIGKTTLLRAFADEIEQSGNVWVLRGRCWERESVPFKGFDGVIDDLVARLEAEALPIDPRGWGPLLVQAFPALKRLRAFADVEVSHEVGGRHTAARVSSAVRALLSDVTASQPVVIIVDDLQWANRDTLALLRGIVDPPLPNALLVAGAREHIEIAPRVDIRRVSLGPLSDADTAELVRMVASELGAGLDATAIARETAGHPLFAAELARHAATTGHVASITFETAVRTMAEALGPEARDTMTIISLAHHPIGAAVIARASEQPSSAAYEAIRTLRTAELIATTGVGEETQVEPAHDRIRRVFSADLPAEERQRLHGKLARALEQQPNTDAFTLALHWSEALDHPRAAVHAMRAAEQAEAALAFHRAADLYKWVSELDPAQQHARVRHAEALAQAGLGVDAADAYLACARNEQAIVALDLRRRAMQQLLLMGHWDRAFVLFEELTTALDLHIPRRPAAQLLSLLRTRLALRRRKPELPPPPATAPPAIDLARIDVLWDAAAGLGLIDPIRAFHLHSLSLDLALRIGDRARIARSLLGDVPYLASPGHPSKRLDALVRLAEETSRLAAFPALPPLCAGVIAFFLGRWRDTLSYLDQAERMLTQDRPRLVKEGIGPAQLLDLTRRFQLVAQVFLGQLVYVNKRTPELLHDAVERNDIASATHLRSGVKSLVHLAFDDVATATRHADEGIAPWQPYRPGIPRFMDVQARVNIAIYTGRGADAHRFVREWFSRLSRAGLFRARYVYITTLDVRARAALAAAREAHRPNALLREASRCARKLRALRIPWAAALADAIDAGVVLARGKDASDSFRRAASAFDAVDMTLHAHNARFAAGEPGARDALSDLGIVDVDAYSGLLLPR